MKLFIILTIAAITFFSGCDTPPEEIAFKRSQIDLRDSKTRLRILKDMYWDIEKTMIPESDKIMMKSSLIGLIFQEVVFGQMPSEN